MSSINSALASLTATYTDSENEDLVDSDEGSLNIDELEELQEVSADLNKTPAISLRLVSYNDDILVSDDDNVSPTRKRVELEIITEKHSALGNVLFEENNWNLQSDYLFHLPPEPKGKCNTELQDKITNLYSKMKDSNKNMNKVIQERKEFRNPSIYEKLIQFCEIDELGTNYSLEVYDPSQWGKESFYEELAKVQKLDMDKREKDRKENAKQIDITQAAPVKIEDETRKRKSKWDQPGPHAVMTAQAIKTSTLQPALTANATGTKGTVISAFGTLPKKPKL